MGTTSPRTPKAPSVSALPAAMWWAVARLQLGVVTWSKAFLVDCKSSPSVMSSLS